MKIIDVTDSGCFLVDISQYFKDNDNEIPTKMGVTYFKLFGVDCVAMTILGWDEFSILGEREIQRLLTIKKLIEDKAVYTFRLFLTNSKRVVVIELGNKDSISFKISFMKNDDIDQNTTRSFKIDIPQALLFLEKIKEIDELIKKKKKR